MNAVVATRFWAHDRRVKDQTRSSALNDLTETQLAAPSWRQALPRIILRIAIIVVGALMLHAAMGWLMDQINGMETRAGQATMTGLLIITLLGYSLLIALPFMPGIEIGVALLLMQGAAVAPLVYLATLMGLFLAYLIGRRVPLRMLHNAFRDLHLRRACEMIAEIERTPKPDRLQKLQDRLPRFLSLAVVNYRYVMLAVLINIPGNVVIGGGGGIMMLAGVLRLFHWAAILLTLAIATLPIPLAVYLMGTDVVIPLVL